MRLKEKLLFLAPQNFYPPIDGGKISIYYPVIYLSKYFKVIVVFPVRDLDLKVHNSITHLKDYGIEVYPFKKNTSDSISLVIKNVFKKVPFKWDKYYDEQAYKEIETLIRKENIKLLFVSSPRMALYAVKLKRKYPHLGLVLREHNIEFTFPKQFMRFTGNPIYKIMAFWQYKKAKKLEQEYWKEFDIVYFISDLDYEIAIGLQPKLFSKSKVLYDGYNIVSSFSEENIINRDIIYPANFSWVLNIINFRWFIKEIWLKVYKELELKLYITGDMNSISWKIVKNITGKSLDELNIINLGFVKNIDEEIAKYRYVLSPTIIGSGLRLKVLNGMALGKVVLCTPLDLKTVNKFKDLYNIVVFKNHEDFVKKILLLNDDAVYSKIAKNAIDTIKQYFNWENYAKQIYDDILRKFLSSEGLK
jgi:glycosyltransferase involved in cell wall biosynthesis